MNQKHLLHLNDSIKHKKSLKIHNKDIQLIKNQILAALNNKFSTTKYLYDVKSFLNLRITNYKKISFTYFRDLVPASLVVIALPCLVNNYT